MNCADCREKMVPWLEGMLESEGIQDCRTHLENCAECRAEYAALAGLRGRLVKSAAGAREVSLVAPVMRQVQNVRSTKERSWNMEKLLMRLGWGLGIGAVTAALALVVLFASPRAHATAGQVMARGAEAAANLTSIHLRGRIRTYPQDNFSVIVPDQEFSEIEMWKQYTPELKWRVDKEQRQALMDGQSTELYVKPENIAFKVEHRSNSAFDTDWLQRIANLSDTITNEIANARAMNWKVSLTEQAGTDGRQKDTVTVGARAGLPDNDYLKNKFFDTSDTRRVYTFDDGTGLLEGVKIYLATTNGEVEVFELTQIDYNKLIAPSVFNLDLPENVNWVHEPQVLPDNEKYAAMTPEQAARAFFEACGRGDWQEVEAFEPTPLNAQIRLALNGLKVVSVGDSFASQSYPGRFVPYEIQFKDGLAKKGNMALRKDNQAGRWIVDGGF